VVLYSPSIKLRVTCVYVLLVVLVVTICPSFQFGSFEDYATNKWTLKHTVSTLKVFGKTNINFGYMDYDSAYTAIIVHP
jgi:hypothetical protein